MTEQEPEPAPAASSPYQQLPSAINYEVPGSPYTAGEVADGGPDAVAAAQAAMGWPPGTLAAPGWPVAGDPNTGLYQPAADQVGIAVGGQRGLVVTMAGLATTGTLDFIQGGPRIRLFSDGDPAAVDYQMVRLEAGSNAGLYADYGGADAPYDLTIQASRHLYLNTGPNAGDVQWRISSIGDLEAWGADNVYNIGTTGSRPRNVYAASGHYLGNSTAAQGGALFGGSGVPAAGLGANGDVYFRTDTPGTANQRIYMKSAGVWVGVV
jgi:hypothetical protein